MNYIIHNLTPNVHFRSKGRTNQGQGSALCVFLATVVFLGFSACSSSPHLVVYQTDQEWVDLREWPIGYPELPLRNHPFTISSETVQQIFQSVYFRESMVFSFVMGNPKPVFTEYQAQRLAETVPQAFEQALPQEIISFQVLKEKNSTYYSSGFCFVEGEEFHLVVTAINIGDFQSKDYHPQPDTSRQELVARPGQRLFSQDPNQKAQRFDWIIVQLESHKGKS